MEDEKALPERVMNTLCQIAFTPATGSAVTQQVRCLELLAKLLGMFDSSGGLEPVTVVEDI